jgi:hypothetical protein
MGYICFIILQKLPLIFNFRQPLSQHASDTEMKKTPTTPIVLLDTKRR